MDIRAFPGNGNYTSINSSFVSYLQSYLHPILSIIFSSQAVGTALWSILAGKRQMLKYDQGFLAHFYSISEHVSPVLVWGFLGPEGSLHSSCHYFRDQVIEFLVDTFNLFKVRYTTVDELAADVFREMKVRIENIKQRLSLLENC